MKAFSWWANKNCKSVLPVTCTRCGFSPNNCTIDKFMLRRSAECWCNNQAKWCTAQGVERLHALMSKSRFVFVEAPLAHSLSCDTELSIACSVCHHQPKSCLLRHFKDTLSAACWCNGRAPYASSEGHKRVLKILTQHHMQPSKELICYDWFVKNVNSEHSVIPVQCIRCATICTSTTISNMLKRKSVGCDCKWKTEKRVKDWVHEHVRLRWVGCEVIGQLTLQSKKRKRGSPMKYDIAIQSGNRVLLVIEIDGRQHFEEDARFLQTQLNDVHKEIEAVTAGIPMLRLFQPDVWNDRFDWKLWLTTMIDAAVSRQLTVAVHRQLHCLKYSEGAYAERRIGTVVVVV